ncbi:MAG: NAD-dependent epimerase/dehydratase family protein [Bacteroidota bacterium]
MRKTILVTGGAGFIASNLIDSLIAEDQWKIISIDNFDPFYARKQKEFNITKQLQDKHTTFIEVDFTNKIELNRVLAFVDTIDVIVHLGAKAGVRPSIENPYAYQITNIVGTQNILDLAIQKKCSQFVFASSSSVYGVNPDYPWKEDNNVLLPISPYASTKVGGELMGHSFYHLNKIRFIALRFFTVFGPRQRPDLAIHQFCKKIQKDEAINVYGDGSTLRDYTYIEDIVQGIRSAMDYTKSNYEIINLGNNTPVKLSELIDIIENVLGKKAKINRMPEQAGDVPITFASIEKAHKLLNYTPQTILAEGIKKFNDWLLSNDCYKE